MEFERIKKAAKRKGLTIKEMLEELNIPESNFYNWQKKGSIETKYLEKIASFLGVPVGYFFGESGGSITVQNGHAIVGNRSSQITISQQQQEIEHLRADLAACREQIRLLQQLLKEKDRVIRLLEQNKKR